MLYFDIQLLKSDGQAVSLTLVIFTHPNHPSPENLVLEVRDKSLKQWAFQAEVKNRKNSLKTI